MVSATDTRLCSIFNTKSGARRNISLLTEGVRFFAQFLPFPTVSVSF